MLKRLLTTLRLYTIRDARDRARYVAKKHIYGLIGENVMIQPRKVPLYAELIKLHNNVWIASGVTFVTHDVVHQMLNWKYPDESYEEKVGCIEIMDNVFVGANSTIMYDVRIGENVVIAAGSIVTKDVPPNSIVAGIPARVIGSFDDFVQKRKNSSSPVPRSEEESAAHRMTSESASALWNDFDARR